MQEFSFCIWLPHCCSLDKWNRERRFGLLWGKKSGSLSNECARLKLVVGGDSIICGFGSKTESSFRGLGLGLGCHCHWDYGITLKEKPVKGLWCVKTTCITRNAVTTEESMKLPKGFQWQWSVAETHYCYKVFINKICSHSKQTFAALQLYFKHYSCSLTRLQLEQDLFQV